MYKPVAVSSLTNEQVSAVRSQYQELTQTFLTTSRDNPFYGYVKSVVANVATLDRHVRAFEIYVPYLKPMMRVLDWGCRHAPDSCMMRKLHPTLDLHGCDFTADDFSVFHNYACLQFKQIEHEYKLPYETNSFDAVVSSGVLEHVGFEHESLLEIWRILKDDGIFAVTFLPNRHSLTENLSRLIGRFGGHNRLYGLAQTKNTLLRSGFVIEKCGYHQVFPTFGKSITPSRMLNGAAYVGAKLNRTVERIPVANLVAANLFFVLRRVPHM